tara:strand:+ start:4011 stop:4712 length:702 start_codon:yes stop_codon:yes gene_type:complete
MALPKLASAKYELTIPSTGEKVEYRPFLVKEEKALLMAQTSGEQADILRAVKEVINACTFEKVDANNLPTFDLEYIFINLRAKSIGEEVNLIVTCPDDNETKVSVKVNLMDVKCVNEVGHDTNIRLTDEIGIIMDYPKVDSVAHLNMDDEVDAMFGVIKSCIRQVYDSNNVYEKIDMAEDDLNEFVESMTHDQFEKVQEFFNTMPKVKHSVKVTNPKTKVESEVVLQGMQDFF